MTASSVKASVQCGQLGGVVGHRNSTPIRGLYHASCWRMGRWPGEGVASTLWWYMAKSSLARFKKDVKLTRPVDSARGCRIIDCQGIQNFDPGVGDRRADQGQVRRPCAEASKLNKSWLVLVQTIRSACEVREDSHLMEELAPNQLYRAGRRTYHPSRVAYIVVSLPSEACC